MGGTNRSTMPVPVLEAASLFASDAVVEVSREGTGAFIVLVVLGNADLSA